MSSTLKRFHSPSSSGCSPKKQRLTSTIIILGNSPNATKVRIDQDPLSITSHDVYKAAIEALGASNSYELSELEVKTIEGDEKVQILATVKEGTLGTEERASKRKIMLSKTLDE